MALGEIAVIGNTRSVIRPVVGAGVDICAAGVGGAVGDGSEEWTSLGEEDTGQFPAAESGAGDALAGRAGGERFRAVPERDFPVGDGEPAVAASGRDVAIIESEVESIRRDGAGFTGEARAVGAGGVAQVLGPRPGGLEAEAAGEALIHFHQERVVF